MTPLISFAIYLALVFLIAGLASRKRKAGGFLNEYFLGNRNIGMWAFALTYAATAASGGSFMGFPAKIYAHGWSLAWWIAGYMVVPILALSLFAKRINQVGRIAKAVTVPELMRQRFSSSLVGQVATLLVVFFMFFYLLAQFKAGAEIMATLLGDVPVFEGAVTWTNGLVSEIPLLVGRGDYLICLLFFAVSVILYTTFGGFRAVVWTDVMQGLVMVIGVVILLFLTLQQTGGLAKTTATLAEMTPPENATVFVHIDESSPGGKNFKAGTWLRSTQNETIRLKKPALILPGKTATADPVEAIILTSAHEIALAKNDLDPSATARIDQRTPYAFGAGQKNVYLTPPGPDAKTKTGFLPLLLAMSFFVFWNFSGAGQPSYMVRQMAYKNTVVLRRSIVMVAVYFALIYFPLVLIFTSARTLLPGMEIAPDRIMPEMAAVVTSNAGVPWLAGLLIAAPFAAVMSSVDSFLLLFSSSIVRDIYQNHINPDASEKRLKTLTYTVNIVVGTLAVFCVLNPPEFLQTLIVFASGGLGACFIVPVVVALYWRNMTALGTVWGMLSGGLTFLALFIIGYFHNGTLDGFYLFGFHPFIWSVLISAIVVIAVSRTTVKPTPETRRKFFG